MGLLNRVQEVVDKISYKPGYEFICKRSEYHDDVIVTLVSVPVLDSTGTGEMRPIRGNLMVATYHDEEYIKRSIFSMIRAMELHEMNEWLKFEGKYIENPHPERDWNKGKIIGEY